mgnify:FL=1|tara:strand:- start:2248 stop:3033 length:786 start_codon:yes stop_codon:yes gene_type:complete
MSRQFVIIPAEAFFDAELSSLQLKVLGALGYHADRAGWCWPGNQTMADLIGCSQGAVSKAISALEASGYLTVIRNKRKGNRYQVIFDRPLASSDIPEGITDIPAEGITDIPPCRNKNENKNENNEQDTQVREAVEIYNFHSIETGWPAVRIVSDPRKKKLLSRLADIGGLDAWREAIARASRSPFLRGETSREGWKANLDFFLQQSSMIKLIEGHYDDNRGNDGGGASGRSNNRGYGHKSNNFLNAVADAAEELNYSGARS